MEISLLNVRITFEKNAVVTDEIGNHTNEWSEFYSCMATVGGEGGKESFVASETVDDTDLTFTVRFCRKVSEIDNLNFRIRFCDEIYNIQSVDHMNYKRKSVKFKCQKVRR